MAADLQKRCDFGQFLNAMGITGVGVEVGAYRGDFARTVLSTWNGENWFLVDPWDASHEFLVRHRAVAWDMDEAWSAAQSLAHEDSRAQLVRLGDPASESLMPTKVDVAYIDGSHNSEAVLQDLEYWWPRIRPGGLLAGHDYLDEWKWSDDINKGILYGVRTAVDWFAQKVGRIVSTTNEPFPTWWFRKPLDPPKRIGVVCASTRDVRWRDIAIRNHTRYCDLYGYSYRHYELEIDETRSAWKKVGLIREALVESDWVIWMDADALFQQPGFRLEHFWDGVSSFVWMKDEINGLNTGVLFARKCDETFEFLHLWQQMSESPEWLHHEWADNGAAIELESRGLLPGLVMPHRTANSYPHIRGEWQPSNFVVHCTGLIPDVRFEMLRDLDFRSQLAFGEVVK